MDSAFSIADENNSSEEKVSEDEDCIESEDN